jgi:hypothetical protein
MESGKVQRYLSYLVRRTPAENLRRATFRTRQLLRDQVGRRRVYKGKTHVTVDQLQRALVSGVRVEDLGARIRQRAGRMFFVPVAFKAELLEALNQLDFNGRERTLKAAEDACAHRFDILGSGLVDLGPEIDWHRDFKTDYCWPTRTYYKKIDGRYLRPDCDIKVPWDLSRAHHLPTLGRAYWLTGDERYPREFITQVRSWIRANPPEDGVNWVNAMETAIRAINWLWAYFLLLDSPQITVEFETEFFGMLLAHGRYIFLNLEGEPGGKYNSNHYISNLAGLIFLGLLIPEFREARKWQEFGITNLIVEMEHQVLADGVDYELSTSYHRLVVEIFITCAVLCRRNGCELPQSFWQVLARMLDFIYHYTRPDGTVPIIGDADNGRLQRLTSWDETEREYYDHRHLLAAGAVLFDRPEWAQAAGKCWEDAFWLLGSDAIQYWKAHLGAAQGMPSSQAFSKGGIYVMRDGDLYAVADAGGNGTGGVGGHNHCDTLSVEFYAYGAPFLVDPGSYVYTADPASRNLFRSTAYHNTIQVDHQELNRLDPQNLFQLGKDAIPEVHAWQSTPEYDLLVASHRGYCRLLDPVTPRRTIFFDKIAKLWLVWDHLEARGEHVYQVFFHFSAVEIIEFSGNPKSIVVCAPNQSQLALCLLRDPGFVFSLRNGWISRSYGRREAVPVAEYSVQVSGTQDWVWGIYPSHGPMLNPEAVTAAFDISCGLLRDAYAPFIEVKW